MLKRELLWLSEAKEDVARLHEFLKHKSPDAASRMVGLLLGKDMKLERATQWHKKSC